MLDNFKNRIKEKKGIGAIASVLILAAMIPLMLFTFVEVPYYNQYNRKMKSIADNAAASAITRIDENELAKGNLLLNKENAKTQVYKTLESWFSLKPKIYKSNINNVYVMKRIKDETGKYKTELLDADPLVIDHSDTKGIISYNENEKNIILNSTRIEFFVHTNAEETTYKFVDGTTVTVKTPTVCVMIQSTNFGMYFKYPMVIKKIGISEVFLDPQTGEMRWEESH